MMVLLDSQALIWLVEGKPDLGRRARHAAERALARSELTVSAITFWEAAVNAEKGRIRLGSPPRRWREEVLALGVAEVPVTGDIGVDAVDIGNFRGDPADRIIMATARKLRATLVTADDPILRWSGDLYRLDARQ